MAEDFSTWTKDGEDFSTWVKDEPAPETGYVKGVAQSLGRGIAGAVQFGGDYLQDNPEYMASGSSEATRDQSKVGILNKIGRTVSDTAESVKNYIPQPVHGGKGFKRSVFEGVESIPTSMALQVPAVAATYAGRAGGALLGAAGGPVGAVAGGVSGGVGAAVLAQSAMSRVMHSATRQQTLEELDRLQANGELRDGITQAEKMQAADEAARAEWQGELPSSVVESLIYSKLPAGRTLSAIIKPGIKQFAKNMAMTLPLELGGEAYTAHEQANAMNSVLAPERKTSPTQAAVDSLGPTAVMTTIMGGAGTMGQRFNGRGIAAALQNPEAPTAHRMAAANVAANYIKSNIGEREAANFRSHALDAIGNAEQTGTDPYALNLDNPELLSTLKTKPATDEDLMATATEALTRAASGESLSDAIEELNAAKVEEKLAQDDALAQALSLEEAPAKQELPTPVENLTPPPQVDTSTGELIDENPVTEWVKSLPFKERTKLLKKATDSPVEAQEYLRRKYEEAAVAPTFTKKSPVPPPNNPAFLTPVDVKEAADGSFEVTQPKAEPVTDKDVPAMLDAISEAYDNGHAMEDYAPENFGKVDGKVYITDTDSMTPLDSPDVVHGSKEELMAAAQAKLAPQTSARSKVEVEEQFNKEFTAKYLQGGIEASRAEDMVDDYAADPAIQQTLDMGEEEAVDYFNSLAEGIKSRARQAVKGKVKLSAKGQSDALQQTSNNSATGRVPTRSELSGEAGSVQTDNKADTGTPRSIRSILATAESDTGGAANATGGSTSVTALQSAGGGVQSAVAPFSLRTAAERLGFLNKTVISKRTGKLYAPGTFRESKDRSLRDRLAEIAGIFGHDVTLMANIPGGDFDGGVAAADKRNIYILESVENPHIAVLGHELVHQIEQNNRSLYVELATAFAELKDDAGFAKYMSKYHKISAVGGKLVVPPDVSEEWVGDVLGLGMTRQSFWDAFYEYSPSLAQRISQLVKDFLARISGKLNGRIMKSEATIKDFKAVDREASRILKKYAESQKDAGGVDGPEFKRLASEKGTQNEKDKFTASILAGASGEAQGSNLGDAQAELARVVGERVYDGRITSPRARKTVEAKALRAWAKAQGLLNDGSAFETEWRKQTNSEGKRIKGNEHDVIFNGDGTVTKRNHLPDTYHVSYKELFDRVALFNYLFGGDATLTLTGFQDTPDGLLPEFSQKDLGGGVARIEQTEKMLSGAGFEPVGNKTTAYRLPGTDIIITDVFGENTRQVGDVTVPMDYVIFHGERARSWLKAQEKVELPEFDEAEFDKGFDAAMKFSATELSEGRNLAKNVTEWFKSFPYLRVLEDSYNTVFRYIMPIDKVINDAAAQEAYRPIKNFLLRLLVQKADMAGHLQASLGDGYKVWAAVSKAFKGKDLAALGDLMFKATKYELHAAPDGRSNKWTDASWKEAGMEKVTGKTLGAALAEIRAEYKQVVNTPEKVQAHRDMLDTVHKVYLEAREAQIIVKGQSYDPAVFEAAKKYLDGKGAPESASAEIKEAVADLATIYDDFPMLQGDYMPLMRFGKYAVRTFKIDGDELGERVETRFFKTKQEALDAANKINKMADRKFHAKVEENMEDTRKNVVNIPAAYLDKIKAAAETRFKAAYPNASQEDINRNSEAIEGLVRDAASARASMMPRTSTVGNKIRRESVDGYSTDLAQVFSSYIVSHANANARIIKGAPIEQTFRDMKNAINAADSDLKNPADPNDIIKMSNLYNNLYRLEKSSNTEKINAAVKVISKTTFIWYLAASPKVFLVQWSQPFVTTIPLLASRYGFGRAFSEYTAAMRRYMAGKYSDDEIDKFEHGSENAGQRLYDLMAKRRDALPAEIKSLNAQIKALYDDFGENGVAMSHKQELLVLKALSLQGNIDISVSHNLGDLVTGADSFDKLEKGVMKYGSFLMQKAETGSRRAAAISSFKLALSQSGDVTQANDYAGYVINETLFDVNSKNRGEMWRGNAGRLFGQFQFFRFHMLGKIIQLHKDAYGKQYDNDIAWAKSEYAKAVESGVDTTEAAKERDRLIGEALKTKKEKRYELAYMIGSSFALAGAGGTPIALALGNTATSAFWSAISFMFGDDDDPWDFKKGFADAVNGTFGDVIGTAMLKGLPSLVGWDLSRSIGLGELGGVVMGEPPAGLTGTAKANWYLGRMAGPAAGVFIDGVRAVDEIKDGNLSGALRVGAPKAIKDLFKAAEVSQRGVQAGGKTILQADDISPYSIALMLSGINPMDVSLAQEESRYVKNLSTEMSQRRSKLIRDVARANVDGEDTGDALAAVSKWTATHPKLGITAQELASGIKKERKSRLGLLTERERLVKEGA